MWDAPFLTTDFYHFANWFLIYSVLGWIVESIYMSLCNRKPTNRGFVRGPICPIYGVGALAAYFILSPVSGNYVAVYFLGTLMATTLEFITAHVMLKVFGAVWWDYKEKPFNYKGIICLESTIAWGFYAVFLFAFLHKAVVRLADSYSMALGKILIVAALLYYVSDFVYCIMRARRNEGLDKDGILVKTD